MKIESEALQTGKITPKIVYDKTQATIHTNENSENFWNPEIFTYAKREEIKIATNLKAALEGRLSGKLTLSIREVDIAARGKFSFASEFMRVAFLRRPECPMLTEGTPGMEITGWNLRVSYNNGLRWFKEKRGSDSKERQEAGDKKLVEVRIKLAEMFLPLWPDEVENGVKTELTKPEWMSWQQYTDACQKKLFTV